MVPRFARVTLGSVALLALLALAGCAATAKPGLPPARPAASSLAQPPPPSRAFEARSFSVRVAGHGAPMILIPGLACRGEVWDDFVRHYEGRYEMHVLTLAGFGGARPVPDASLAMVRDDLARYIHGARMQKPIVVGHSLGGAIAFALAEREPESIGAVVAVDGVPYLAALMNPAATPERMSGHAHQMAASIAAMSPEAFRATNRASVETMVSDPAEVDRIAAWGAASDLRTVGNAMAELMTTDLRVDEGRIQAPVLLLAGAKNAATPEAKLALAAAYEAQVAQIARHKVVLATNARHFIMLDDPAFLYETFDSFAGAAVGGAPGGPDASR
jgi:N-formylmaleamate deformylase